MHFKKVPIELVHLCPLESSVIISNQAFSLCNDSAKSICNIGPWCRQIFVKWAIQNPFLDIYLSNTVFTQLEVNKIWQWLDLNHGSLVLRKNLSTKYQLSHSHMSSNFKYLLNCQVMSALGVVAGVEAAAVQLQKLVDGLWAEKSSKKKLDRSLRKNYS